MHISLASIQGGMPMVNEILTVLSIVGYILEKILNTNIPPRSLGVKYINLNK